MFYTYLGPNMLIAEPMEQMVPFLNALPVKNKFISRLAELKVQNQRERDRSKEREKKESGRREGEKIISFPL